MKQKLVIAKMPVGNTERIVSVLFEDDKPAELQVSPLQEAGSLGNIYVGHVTRLSPQSGGIFVRFQKDTEGYLPMGKAKYAVMKSKHAGGQLRPEDELLVQLEVQAQKTKLPGLTTELTLAGTCMVISSALSGLRFSQKLVPEEIGRLRKLFESTQEEYSGGFILRTAAAAVSDETILAEARELSSKLADILRYGTARPWGTCLSQADSAWMEKFRRLIPGETGTVVTDIPEVYEILKENAKEGMAEKIRLYEDPQLALYRLYGFSSILDHALERKVWLPSGASIIIEQTEAFVCIDVNSSKTVKKKTAQETFKSVNQEAAREIARQIRLRELSGTILIDFITMASKEAKTELLEDFAALMKRDSARTQVVDMTALDIMEVTRRKKGPSLAEQMKL